MLIDWFTVAAQIVNFLILVGLLKYFLYDRIVRAMDERERAIRERLDDAEQRRSEAQQKEEEYRQKHQELEERRREVLEQARRDAQEERKQMIEDARNEVDELKRAWRESVQREKDSFLRELHGKLGKEAVAVARKTLDELAHEELEHTMAQVFIEKLRDLDEDSLRELRQTDEDSDTSVVVHSAFDLNDELRDRIQSAIRDTLDSEMEIRFEPAPELMCGIVLRRRGIRVGWDIRSFLESMEGSVAQLVETHTHGEESERSAGQQEAQGSG